MNDAEYAITYADGMARYVVNELGPDHAHLYALERLLEMEESATHTPYPTVTKIMQISMWRKVISIIDDIIELKQKE